MAVAALVGVLVMVGVVDVLMRVNLSFMLMWMHVLISGMATHWLSPPFVSCLTYSLKFGYITLFEIIL
jgi:heme A synthase